MTDEYYISIVGEIFDGYSECEFDGRLVYLKHLTVKDQRYIHVYYEKYKNSAIKRGVKTEKEILDGLKEDGLWNSDDDFKIATLETEIQNLNITKKSMFLKSQKDEVQKTINEKQSIYYKLKNDRHKIVGKTAEDYASNMSSIEMIRYFVFDSKDLDKHAFSKSDFDEMDDYLLSSLQKIQEETRSRLNELDIQKAVLRPFFSMYLSFCDNAKDFFGKPVIDLSVFQMKLVLFGKIFQSIFQYVEDIPDGIKQDPEKLMAFSESKNDKSKNKSFLDENASASTVFGGTEEDINEVAGEGKAISLSKEIKKAGGKLDMAQMMKLAGK